MSELAKCCECGSEATLVHVICLYGGLGKRYRVGCVEGETNGTCKMSTGLYDTREEAVEAWNKENDNGDRCT